MVSNNTLPTDQLYTLLAEVVNKVPVDQSTLPDTPLVRSTRSRMEQEVADMVARGLTPDVPSEWHDPVSPQAKK